MKHELFSRANSFLVTGYCLARRRDCGGREFAEWALDWRGLRVVHAGGRSHVTARGNERRDIFRHQRSGHLYQGRFKSMMVERERWGLGLSRYLHLNPVRVGRLGLGKNQLRASRSIGIGQVDRQLVKARVEELRRYPWSSLRAYYGVAKAPSWLTTGEVLALGGRAGDRAKRLSTLLRRSVGARLGPESLGRGGGTGDFGK